MSKHTPGPWSIGTPPPNGEQTIGSKNGLMVAVATTGAGVPTEANASLIAAAPDLLAFAQEFLSDYQSEDGMASMKHYAKQAHDAIAKATGENNV